MSMQLFGLTKYNVILESVDNFLSYPHSIHIFLWVMHISMLVLYITHMLQCLHIKENADLIKSFYAFGRFMKDASELQDISVDEIQFDETEYGRLWPMIVVVKNFNSARIKKARTLIIE